MECGRRRLETSQIRFDEMNSWKEARCEPSDDGNALPSATGPVSTPSEQKDINSLNTVEHVGHEDSVAEGSRQHAGEPAAVPSSNAAATTCEPYVDFLQSLSQRWSSWSAAQLLTLDVIQYMIPRFHFCSTPIKIRILTSFLYLKPALRERCKVELSELLCDAETDRDDWVRKLSRLLQPFIATGRMDVKETDTETAYKVIQFLDDQKALHNLRLRMKEPLEAPHMCDPMNPTDFVSRETEHHREDTRQIPSDSNRLHTQLRRKFSNDLASEQSAFSGRATTVTPPPYQYDTKNFRPTLDFRHFMREVERKGLQRMAKAEAEYERRRRGTSVRYNESFMRGNAKLLTTASHPVAVTAAQTSGKPMQTFPHR